LSISNEAVEAMGISGDAVEAAALEGEHLLIMLMRRNPAAEVQLRVEGELVSATRAGQVLASIEAMQAAAWEEGEAAGQDNADSNRGHSVAHKYNPYRTTK
jgi:hypothetical protein